jgi:hypothetical protein
MTEFPAKPMSNSAMKTERPESFVRIAGIRGSTLPPQRDTLAVIIQKFTFNQLDHRP